MILHRRTFFQSFQSLFGIGAVAAVPEPSRVFVPAVPARGVSATTPLCPKCGYSPNWRQVLGESAEATTRPPMDEWLRILATPREITCPNTECGCVYVGRFMQEFV